MISDPDRRPGGAPQPEPIGPTGRVLVAVLPQPPVGGGCADPGEALSSAVCAGFAARVRGEGTALLDAAPGASAPGAGDPTAADRIRGRISTALGLVICGHRSRQVPGGLIVTVECGERQLPALLGALRRAGVALLVVSDERGVRGSAGPERDPQVLAQLTRAGSAHSGRRGGRAVVFPGQDRLDGEHRVGELTALTAIDGVHAESGPCPGDAVVSGCGSLRPVYRDGELVLEVGTDAEGRLVPVERAAALL